jgi:hypothetical protein
MTREQWLQKRIVEIGDEYRRAYDAAVAPFYTELLEIETRRPLKIVLDKAPSTMLELPKVEDTES